MIKKKINKSRIFFGIIIVLIIFNLIMCCFFLKKFSTQEHLIKGLIYETEFQFEEAIEEYKEADNSIIVLSKIATLYTRIGKYNESEKILKEIIEKDKNNIEAHFDLAGNYYFTGQFENSIREYNEVLKLNSQSVVSLNNLGNIYYDKNEIDKASFLL